MTDSRCQVVRRLFTLATTLTAISLAADSGMPVLLQVDGGLVTFDATTNVSAVTVHGKANALKARLRVRQQAGQLVVEQVQARLPVEALTTGMSLRDGHMKKNVFTDANGNVPELKFSGENLACPLEAGKEASCKFTGTMSIRGVEKPMTMELKVKSEAGRGYRASGDSTVKLSDYGIERPSQFGVKVGDTVKIHVDFQGRETVEASALGEGR